MNKARATTSAVMKKREATVCWHPWFDARGCSLVCLCPLTGIASHYCSTNKEDLNTFQLTYSCHDYSYSVRSWIVPLYLYHYIIILHLFKNWHKEVKINHMIKNTFHMADEKLFKNSIIFGVWQNIHHLQSTYVF